MEEELCFIVVTAEARMLCQASVQKVACGCHSQKEKGTAWINIGFRHFCGCFAWHFKQFENW